MTSLLISESQPWKTLYLIWFFATLILVKLPAWFIWYLVPSHRPRRSWTIKRALIVRTIRELWTLEVDIDDEKRDPSEEVPDSELTDAKFVWVDGIPDKLFRGEVHRIADITNVHPTRIAGYWLFQKNYDWIGLRAKLGEKTILHLHGGAFYVGTANPSDTTANFTRGLLEHMHTIQRTFAVDYRLTASAPKPPANPFPAALLDALAGYRYLVHDAGFAPENIIVAGDSAGGNLALALVRHLIENPTPSLPPPGRILTASAWLDLSSSRRGPGSSAVLNAPSDIFDERPGELFAKYAVVSLLGPMGFEVAQTHRYLSPVSLACKPETGLFAGFPETYVVAGGAERLLDDSTALVERMRADGVIVIQDIPPDAVHDFLVFTWHDSERTEVLKRLSRWVDMM
ncbi:alpha/beta-hydrolase [Polyporus arcularius HHB13444]|uniref:Alpha/beta-hydrolase n=1 Tax=Polyporus arcularius HHB13444 TaxID=1314778 RepID=A0A5C3PIC4_9APHY|nr:alpha/beta-hydrolase [Polyporus arcularius HHB13444]